MSYTPVDEELGWSAHWDEAFAALDAPGQAPARVIVEHRGAYRIATSPSQEYTAKIPGRWRREATAREELPAVGDFVSARLPDDGGPAVILALLPRRTAFVRIAAGERTDGQVVAANVDTVFLMSALDHDFNVRRIERYLTLAWNSGAEPVIVLNKADLCAEVEARVAEVRAVALDVPILVLSALVDESLSAIAPYRQRGRTIALLGSSGVGKSTLTNRLLGVDTQATSHVREGDHRGRHTTSHRELFVLPGGGMIVDTPGMRELHLGAADEGLAAAFGDVEGLATSCRFDDCQHHTEPSCAVRAAVERGELPIARFESYRKLTLELRRLGSRTDKTAVLERKRSHKLASKSQKDTKREE